MNTKDNNVISYRPRLIWALIIGIIGIALQFINFGLLSFILTSAVLGGFGLIGGRNSYQERDRQQIEQIYSRAFGWLLFVVLVAYPLVEFSKWFVGIGEAVTFLNRHWPGLMLSVACIIMGLAGLQKARTAGSA